MASVVINDVIPRSQFTATASQTVFDTTWTIDDSGASVSNEEQILVYARAAGVDADDEAQIVSTTDYNVTLVGASQTVRVTFTSGRTAGDIVTIVRATPTDRQNLYTNTNFTPSMLNGDFGRLVLNMQQNQLDRNAEKGVGVRYNYSEELTLPNDQILPKLGARQGWRKNAANTAIEVYNLPDGDVAPGDATYLVQTADSDLPNAQAMGALASGIVVNTNSSGVQLTRVLTGTANQIGITNSNGISGNPTFSIVNNPIIPGNEKIRVPVGTTAQRPSSPANGDSRFNTDLQALEVYSSVGGWDALSGGVVDSVVGTSNQIDVNNTDPQNPVLTLSTTVNLPGTFNIQSTTAIDSILDEDGMGSDSATALATQQSIKAYVDAQVGGTPTSIVGTANQVLANGNSGTNETGTVTLTTPQNIGTSNSPTFAGMTLTGALNMSSQLINNVLDPVSAQDAANKAYVDSRTDLHYMEAVLAASTGNFASTYNNGTSGVGATLTASSNGAFSLDGESGVLNARYLMKDQTTTYEIGIYTLTQVGDGSNPAILTRTTDFDQADEIDPGDIVPVLNGTVNGSTAWIQTATVNTVGTDPITFSQWTADFSNVVTLDGTQTVTGSKTFNLFSGTLDGTLNANGNAINSIGNINISGDTITNSSTTLDLVGANFAVRHLGIQDGTTQTLITNTSSGTSAIARYRLINDVGNGYLSLFSSNYASTPSFANRLLLLGDSGIDGITISANAKNIVLSTNTGSDHLVVNSSGQIGLNLSAANTGTQLDILSSTTPLGIRGAGSVTDATVKNFKIGGRHYTNAEEDVLWIYGLNQSTVNRLLIGGGASQQNALTSVEFYTGATNTTTTGTKVAEFTINGLTLSSSGSTVGIIRDEDNMSSDDANALATQQSIKAYADNLTGLTLQEKTVSSTTGGATTTTIPLDNTIPQITEGSQFFSLSITPSNVNNILEIQIYSPLVTLASPGSYAFIGALFQDGGADAIQSVFGGTSGQMINFRYRMVSGTTSSTTFTFRYGPSSAGTAYMNRGASGELFGGASYAYMSIKEIQQ